MNTVGKNCLNVIASHLDYDSWLSLKCTNTHNNQYIVRPDIQIRWVNDEFTKLEWIGKYTYGSIFTNETVDLYFTNSDIITAHYLCDDASIDYDVKIPYNGFDGHCWNHDSMDQILYLLYRTEWPDYLDNHLNLYRCVDLNDGFLYIFKTSDLHLIENEINYIKDL